MDKAGNLKLQAQAEDIFNFVTTTIKWESGQDWNVLVGEVSSLGMESQTDHELKVITIAGDCIGRVSSLSPEHHMIILLAHEIAHALLQIEEGGVWGSSPEDAAGNVKFIDEHPNNLYALQMDIINAVSEKLGYPALKKEADRFVAYKRNIWPEVISMCVSGVAEEDFGKSLKEKTESFYKLHKRTSEGIN